MKNYRHYMNPVRGLCLSALLMAGFHSLAAQETLPQHNDDPSPGIIVERSLAVEPEQVREAVRDIAMRGRRFTRPLTRFQEPLCLHVAGLGEKLGAQISARIEENTRAAGFVVGDPGCETNALVLIVEDAEGAIKRLRKTQRQLFTVSANQKITAAQRRGDVAIGWSMSRIADVRGRAIGESGTFAGAGVTGKETVSQNAHQGVPTTASGGLSRFLIPYSIERVFSVLVFDARRMDGVHLDQIADFATMKLLADPQPTVELEEESPADSILTLFDLDPFEAPQKLTQVDRAYLRGLYSMRPNEPGSRLEKFVLAAYNDILKEDCAEGIAPGCADTEEAIP